MNTSYNEETELPPKALGAGNDQKLQGGTARFFDALFPVSNQWFKCLVFSLEPLVALHSPDRQAMLLPAPKFAALIIS